MTKIKLLKDGGYMGFPTSVLPVEVAAELRDCGMFYVPEAELARIGCDMDSFDDEEDPFWPFSVINGECEVVE